MHHPDRDKNFFSKYLHFLSNHIFEYFQDNTSGAVAVGSNQLYLFFFQFFINTYKHCFFVGDKHLLHLKFAGPFNREIPGRVA